MYGGTHSLLIDPAARERVLSSTGWSGHHDVGQVEVWADGTFSDGLTARQSDDGGALAFFSAVREHHRLVEPTFEITPTFLWYWDAFPTDDGWSYLNAAGRDVELIRVRLAMDAWKVEVAALELRTYLADAHRELLVQKDYTIKTDHAPFARVDSSCKKPWLNFDWFAMHEASMEEHPSFSTVMGKYVVEGARTSRVRRIDERDEPKRYVEFVYGIDSNTGEVLRHTCDPNQLGDYGDSSRQHSMTPVYFAREVLGRYAGEPARYSVTTNRISCLDLWGLDIGTNTVGLVEVYLGDLGRLTEAEQSHWLAHNVQPEGAMDEGRFRRDFLNQWASSPDPVGELRRARTRAAEATAVLLGAPVWRYLDTQTSREFEELLGPTTSDPSAIAAPTIILTKALVDGIDPKPLKKYLGGAQPNERSLSLLRRFLVELGDAENSVEAFIALQGFRSAGGIAHLGGSGAAAARQNLGIDGMPPQKAFLTVTGRLAAALQHITALVEAADRAKA
ncbi:hypothetical protein C8K30_1179 [Promicromonospora sp. AC04]|nr:hypothetical protein C8K30_1179 [Promicromonospora sp. AC04]